MGKIKTNNEFEQIAILIEEARNRAFHKVNEELVLFYFKVGSIVSIRVAEGTWGENTVGELAIFVQNKFRGFSGFTRRVLYRMKQFYEVYSSGEFVSPLATQIEAYFTANKQNRKVSALPTQLYQLNALQEKLVALILCKVTWSNHLEILSQTKSPEEKFFYLLHCIKEKWPMRDLRRQLTSGYFERTMLSDKKVSPVLTQLPQGSKLLTPNSSVHSLHDSPQCKHQ